MKKVIAGMLTAFALVSGTPKAEMYEAAEFTRPQEASMVSDDTPKEEKGYEVFKKGLIAIVAAVVVFCVIASSYKADEPKDDLKKSELPFFYPD
jgi:hypothetical protein